MIITNKNYEIMKMKILGMILITMVVLFAFKPVKESYTADVKTSKLTWTGYHLAKSYEHVGNIQLKSGSLQIDGGKLTGGSFVIDMTSITNNDLESEKKKAKLTKDLRSERFFYAEKFPTAKLVIKKVENSAGGKYKASADLTIRGITKPIDFEGTLSDLGGDKYKATAKMEVERTQYEVMYGWSVENAMLSDEFLMEVEIVAKK
jgi:polyisoprenoid-binding protein YceI